MRNAVRFDKKVTVGIVPDYEDLAQLLELGYQTLIDLRHDDEKFGGVVERRARSAGFRYVSVPIDRAAISVDRVVEFYRSAYDPANGLVYAFSRFGKKPLAFLLLLEAVACGEPIAKINQRASRFAFGLEGDLTLQSFLVGLLNTNDVDPILQAIREVRPDLLQNRGTR